MGREATKLACFSESNNLTDSSLLTIDVSTVEQAKAQAEYSFASQVLSLFRSAEEVSLPIFAIDDVTGESSVISKMILPLDRTRVADPFLIQTVFHPMSFISLAAKANSIPELEQR